MTNLSHRNHKFDTVHNKWSKIPPSTSMHFVTHVGISCVLCLSWSSCLLMRAAASETWVRFKQLYLSNHVCMNFFPSQWLILPPLKILTFPPQSPCINFTDMIFEVHTMACIWMMVLQNVMPCAFVCGRQHFWYASCLCLQGGTVP